MTVQLHLRVVPRNELQQTMTVQHQTFARRYNNESHAAQRAPADDDRSTPNLRTTIQLLYHWNNVRIVFMIHADYGVRVFMRAVILGLRDRRRSKMKFKRMICKVVKAPKQTVVDPKQFCCFALVSAAWTMGYTATVVSQSKRRQYVYHENHCNNDISYRSF